MNFFLQKRFFGKILVIAIFVATSMPAASASASKVAVFPLEDLSRGANGVNLPLTRFLSSKLKEKGEEVLPLEKVIAYMARHRIRWLGFLDTKNILRVRRELGADIVLLGTVCQIEEEPSPALGLILTAVETKSAGNVWSESGAVSCLDIAKALGLAEPEGVDDLRKILVNRLLQTWSPGFTPGIAPSRSLLESSLIEPRNVKPGEIVKCTVRLKDPEDWGNDPASVMKLNQDLHYSSLEATMGRELEKKSGNDGQIQLMVGSDEYLVMEEKTANIYEAAWPAPDQNGSFPITLVLKKMGEEQQVIFLGNYRVDGQIPQLELRLNAQEINGETIFSKELSIVPVWQISEHVSRWFVAIKDKEGKIQISGKGEGDLPSRFKWKGQRASGTRVPDGIYDLVLKVWDLAGNKTELHRKITLKATPPIPEMIVEKKKDRWFFYLSSESEIPIDYWTGRFFFADGETILEEQGFSLPVQLPIQPDLEGLGRPLKGIVTIQDKLGNRTKRKIENLLALIPQEEEKKDSQDREWVVEF